MLLYLRRLLITSLSVFMLFTTSIYAKENKNLNKAKVEKLQKLLKKLKKEEKEKKVKIKAYIKKHKLKVHYGTDGGIFLDSRGKRGLQIKDIVNGIPRYISADNLDAAVTTNTNKLWSETLPFKVTGKGYNKLAIWDVGAVRRLHIELNNRITQEDSATEISNHATHVAGTMVASGVELVAKGMAFEANLFAYDSHDDVSEMCAAAIPENENNLTNKGLEVSNHSYGTPSGWEKDENGDWHWHGDTTISQNECYYFGFYSEYSQVLDQISYDAPNYLIVKSAGNNRSDAEPTLIFASHTHNGEGSFSDNHYDDGFDNGGFDTVGHIGVAKNILTVGAVKDISDESSRTLNDIVMSDFSGWGPADDGRIKPDIVANGIEVYSSIGTSDTAYDSYDGTSMAAPNASGTIALLQQYYQKTHHKEIMLSSTAKALVIHTADEAGADLGPDYEFGWGLLNAQKAAEKIQQDISESVMAEPILENGATWVRTVTIPENLEHLKITIAWTDPPGTPSIDSLDPEDKMLVNDLDLRVIKDEHIYYPWSLTKDDPSMFAFRTRDNNIDNVEQVYIIPQSGSQYVEPGIYTIEVSHKGTLVDDNVTTASQQFSIISDVADMGDTTSKAFLPAIITYLLSDDVVTTGTITHNGTTYGTVTSPYTGKVWLDRNLGASQVCTSFDDAACYGDYYQWGRNYDGHQESNSSTISTQATDVNSAGSSFRYGNSDWASVDSDGSQRTANWSKTDGTSVCPVGFRVPSVDELKAETLDNGVTNSATAFSNFLALPLAGYRYYNSASMGDVGFWGYVWASSVNGSGSHFVYYLSDYAGSYYNYRAYGFAVRCLKD